MGAVRKPSKSQTTKPSAQPGGADTVESGASPAGATAASRATDAPLGRSGRTGAVVWALFAALVIMTVSGVGTIAIVSVLGLVLCGIGLSRPTARVDWWVLAPLAAYVGMNLVSSFAFYGDVVNGYGGVQLIYVSMYALSCCLDARAARRLRELCVLWAAIAATLGIIGFVASSFFVSVTRLAFVVGAPNALGIFLVLGWFALLTCRLDEDADSRLARVLPRLEPVILVAMTLTLSMGAFVALLIGIVVFLAGRLRTLGWREALDSAFILVSKIATCIIVGLLMYMAAERADVPALAAVLAAYVVAMAFIWPRFGSFLRRRPGATRTIAVVGLLCVPFAIVMRPSSLATFAERIHMMGNGIGYLRENPLTGVGPGQWRFLNLADSDTYFNTNHIHNLFIHAGVEFGIVAMVALAVIAVRCFVKRYRYAQHGEDAAFLTHVMMDTGFFYLGVTGMLILTANGSTTPAPALPKAATKALFAVLGVAHLTVLLTYLAMY